MTQLELPYPTYTCMSSEDLWRWIAHGAFIRNGTVLPSRRVCLLCEVGCSCSVVAVRLWHDCGRVAVRLRLDCCKIAAELRYVGVWLRCCYRRGYGDNRGNVTVWLWEAVRLWLEWLHCCGRLAALSRWRCAGVAARWRYGGGTVPTMLRYGGDGTARLRHGVCFRV